MHYSSYFPPPKILPRTFPYLNFTHSFRERLQFSIVRYDRADHRRKNVGLPIGREPYRPATAPVLADIPVGPFAIQGCEPSAHVRFSDRRARMSLCGCETAVGGRAGGRVRLSRHLYAARRNPPRCETKSIPIPFLQTGIAVNHPASPNGQAENASAASLRSENLFSSNTDTDGRFQAHLEPTIGRFGRRSSRE